MKKLTKILLSAVLSASMLVAGGLAFANYKPVVKAADKIVDAVELINTVERSNGYVTLGTFASASGAGSGVEYSGLRLSGGTNAEFKIGPIDISKSNWIPSDSTQGHGTKPSSASPFITWAPIIDNTSSKLENSKTTFIVAEHNNPDNYFEVVWEANGATGYKTYAKASGQNGYGGYRHHSTKGYVPYPEGPGWITKNAITVEGASIIGVTTTEVKSAHPVGSVVPMAMFYDTNRRCVYSNVTYGDTASGLEVSYAIRDFNEGSYDLGAASTDNPWAGFTSNLVDVTVKFGSVSTNNEANLVISNIGGFDLSSQTITIGDNDYGKAVNYENVTTAGKGNVTLFAPEKSSIVTSEFINGSYVDIKKGETNVATVTFNKAKEVYNFTEAGTYTLNWYDDEANLLDTTSLVITNGYQSTHANYGYHTLSRYSSTTLKGIRLTGATNDVFDLGVIDLAGSNWNGTDTTVGDTAPTTNFEFYFDTLNVNTTVEQHEITYLDVTLTEVDNPNNYFTMRYKTIHNMGVGVISNESRIYKQAAAAGQSFGSWRSDKTTVANQTPEGNSIKSEAASLLGYGSSEVFLYPVGSAVPCSFTYDFDDNKLYSVQTGVSNTALQQSYLIRNFGEEIYSNIATPADTTWAGFTSSKVRVTVKFAELDNVDKGSIVVTKVGNYDLSNLEILEEDIQLVYEVPNIAAVDNETIIGAPYKYHDLLKNYVSGAKAVISKGGEVVDTISFTGETASYVFTEAGEYTLVYQDANGDDISEPITITAQLGDVVVEADITVKNGDYEVYDNEGATTTEFNPGYVVRFIPTSESRTTLLYSDVRSLTIGNDAYSFSDDNPNGNIPLNRVESGKNVYYEYTIEKADLINGYQLNINIAFDRWSSVKVYDDVNSDGIADGAPISSATLWSTDGRYGFPLTVANNTATIATGNSNKTKVLLGYARQDLAHKDANGTFVVDRDDVTIPEVDFTDGIVYYQSHAISMDTGATARKSLFVPMPNMEFITVYMEVKIDTEFKLTSGYTNEYSGLRFVLKFNKVDLDNYNKYRPYKSSGNPLGQMHLYVTTVNELKAGGKLGITDADTIDTIETKLKNISAANFNNDGWNSSTTANHLGLYNDKTPGYVYKYVSGGAEIFNEYYLDNDYYGMCITVNELKADNYNKQYVFMPCIAVQSVAGASTSKLVQPKLAVPSVEAGEKLTEVLKTEEFTGYNYKFEDQNGVTYYSKYTATDMNWLAGVAGDTRTFTKVA